MTNFKRFRRFKCRRCGLEFIKRHSSIVERCLKCQTSVIDKDHRGSLDPYSQMKHYWYKYPKYWENQIKHRKLIDGKVYILDDKGYKIGVMPELI